METMLKDNMLLTMNIIMSSVLKMSSDDYQTVLTYVNYDIPLFIDDYGYIYTTEYPTNYGIVCKATYLI